MVHFANYGLPIAFIYSPLNTLIVHQAEIEREVHRCYNANSSTTAVDVQRNLKTRGVIVSAAQIRRTRLRLGYKRTTTKYCHTIRDENKEVRVEFSILHLALHSKFTNCIFTDESIAQSKFKPFDGSSLTYSVI